MSAGSERCLAEHSPPQPLLIVITRNHIAAVVEVSAAIPVATHVILNGIDTSLVCLYTKAILWWQTHRLC